MQMVPVEATNGAMRGLHTLYDWGSTVTLVRRESARRLGFRPAQVAQRVVNGLGGAAVVVTGCHYLPLVDVRGKHQVVCAFEVEEIGTRSEHEADEILIWSRLYDHGWQKHRTVPQRRVYEVQGGPNG